MAEQTLLASLKALVEKHPHVKLGTGVIGKSSRVGICVCVVWMIVVTRISGTFADVALVLSGVAASAFGVWWMIKTQSFAEKNPEATLLEEAEFTEVADKSLRPD